MIARLVLAFIIVAPGISFGQHLGVHGSLWEIQEEDAVGYIKRRLGDMEKDGSLTKLQQDRADRITNSVINQKPVPGYSVATKNFVRRFDPTVAIDRAVVDASGKVLYPAGTRVNPLMYGGLSHRYIFIDARELAQVDFALGEVKAHAGDAIILVAGDWVFVSKRLGSQAYYDQGGAMTKRFQLSKTPSIVSQDGLRLKIEEFAVGGEK